MEIFNLQVCEGSNITPSDSDVRILGHHAFYDIKVNFHKDYIDTDWGMHTVAFIGIVVPLMEYIPVHAIMEKLQCLMLYAIGMG